MRLIPRRKPQPEPPPPAGWIQCTGTTARRGRCMLEAEHGTDRCVFHPRQPEDTA